LAGWLLVALAGFGGQLARLGFGDPCADHGGVAVVVERGAVLGELPFAVFDLGPQGGFLRGRLADLGCGERVEGGGQMPGVEGLGEPGVDPGENLGFAQVDGAAVGDVVGEGVFGREGAPVVGLVVPGTAARALAPNSTARPWWRWMPPGT
jgi:hypothetical protein